MILVGSQAAILRDCLPSWRDGTAIDYDFHGSVEEAASLESYLRDAYGAVIVGQKRRSRIGMLSPGNVLIDFDASGQLSSAMIAALPDNEEALVLGQTVQVISCTTQLLIKLSYADYAINRAKNDQDIAHWEQMLGTDNPAYTPAHHAVFLRMVEENAARFADKALPLTHGTPA